jgi:LEA14-like dessication related protein
VRTVAVVGSLVLIAAVTAAYSGSGLAASKRPTLQLTDLNPLTVRGLNFRPEERVKLLVSAGGAKRLAVKANQRGTFTLALRVELDRCTAVVVQAFGSRGSRAMVDITAPDCASIDRADIG